MDSMGDGTEDGIKVARWRGTLPKSRVFAFAKDTFEGVEILV